MAVRLDSNKRGGEGILFSAVVEDDDGAFLSIAAVNDDYDEVFDYFTTEPGEVEEFFRVVAEAKANWDRLTGEG